MTTPAEETSKDTLESCDLIRRSGFAIVETVIIRSSLLNDAHVRLFANLATYCTPGRVVWPGQKQLAEDIGKRPDTISALLAHMKKIDLIVKHWTGVRWQWMIQVPPPNSVFWRSAGGKINVPEPAPDLGNIPSPDSGNNPSPPRTDLGNIPSRHAGTVIASEALIQELSVELTDDTKALTTSTVSQPSANADGRAPAAGPRGLGIRRVRIPPDSDLKIVRAAFVRLHQQHVGQPYMPVHGRDNVLWKKLLSTYGLARVEVILDLFFDLGDERGFSVPGLVACLPRLLPRLSEMMQARRREKTTEASLDAVSDRDVRWRAAQAARGLERGKQKD